MEIIPGRLATAEVLPCSKEKFLGWRTWLVMLIYVSPFVGEIQRLKAEQS